MGVFGTFLPRLVSLEDTVAFMLFVVAGALAGPATEAAQKAVEDRRAADTVAQTEKARDFEEAREDFLRRLGVSRDWIAESLLTLEDIQTGYNTFVRGCGRDDTLVTGWNTQIDQIEDGYRTHHELVMGRETLAGTREGGFESESTWYSENSPVAARGFRTWDALRSPIRRMDCDTPSSDVSLRDYEELYNQLQELKMRIAAIEGRVKR